jgi:hypothetical protein
MGGKYWRHLALFVGLTCGNNELATILQVCTSGVGISANSNYIPSHEVNVDRKYSKNT